MHQNEDSVSLNRIFGELKKKINSSKNFSIQRIKDDLEKNEGWTRTSSQHTSKLQTL